MRGKRFSKYLFCFSILLIGSGLVFDYWINYQLDKKQTFVLIDSISQQTDQLDLLFQNTEDKILSMNDFFQLYSDDAFLQQEKYATIMKQIGGEKQQIEQAYEKLSSQCEDVIYGSSYEQCRIVDTNYANFTETYQSLEHTYQNFVQKWDHSI